jgi:hypothetical protein
MTHPWDEFSKSLAELMPRRESLRRLGIAFAGVALSALAIPSARARLQDRCKSFCNKCRNKSQQNQCLTACRSCNGDPSRLCGSCGNYACVDLGNDVRNCGKCGYVCPQPGPNEYGACIDGFCEYACAQGAEHCNGACTFLDWDSNNCGVCGNICGGSTPYCNLGVCSECPAGAALCGGECIDVLNDPDNCGACGNSCGEYACIEGWCNAPCAEGLIRCNGVCVDPMSDWSNCGNCGVQCDPSSICITGYCHGGGGGW